MLFTRLLAMVTAVLVLLGSAAPVGLGSSAAIAAVAAEEMPVPVELQVAIILKVLTYDRKLADRGRELRIAVVFAADDPASARAKADVTEALQRVSDKTVRGMRIRVSAIESGDEAEGAARAGQIAVFYIAPGNARQLERLVRISREQHILTTTGVPEYVGRGVAVGVGVKEDRPQIIINLAAARAAGSEFDASLLRIVKVVR